MEEIVVKSNQEGILEIRKGDALPLREPVKITIEGQINSPLRYLQKRIDKINQKSCIISVNRIGMSIRLCVDEKNYYRDKITGAITKNPEFENFGINAGHSRTTHELAEFIKMNRYFFESKGIGMELVSQLMNFKGKVDKEIENLDDKRGNKRLLINQAVASNIPDSFKLNMPLFTGQSPVIIEVEINIDASDFSCTLISPDVNDIIREYRDDIIDAQLEDIIEIAPDIVIIEL